MKGPCLMGADIPPRSLHEPAQQQQQRRRINKHWPFWWSLALSRLKKKKKRDNKERKCFRRDKNVFKCAGSKGADNRSRCIYSLLGRPSVLLWDTKGRKKEKAKKRREKQEEVENNLSERNEEEEPAMGGKKGRMEEGMGLAEGER